MGDSRCLRDFEPGIALGNGRAGGDRRFSREKMGRADIARVGQFRGLKTFVCTRVAWAEVRQTSAVERNSSFMSKNRLWGENNQLLIE